MLVAPSLTPRHRKDRVDWARENLQISTSIWSKPIWNDDKKLNLDGPDRFSKYEADSRLERRYFSRRQNGGHGLNVKRGFSAKGKPPLAFLKGNIDAPPY